MNCATTSREDKGFNSKLVRLEVSRDSAVTRFTIVFQFQTGSIRRISHFMVFLQSNISFNSKLVRLKVRTNLANNYTAIMFQFQTGAIKSKLPSNNRSVLYDGFNSKLVRLKETSTTHVRI